MNSKYMCSDYQVPASDKCSCWRCHCRDWLTLTVLCLFCGSYLVIDITSSISITTPSPVLLTNVSLIAESSEFFHIWLDKCIHVYVCLFSASILVHRHALCYEVVQSSYMM